MKASFSSSCCLLSSLFNSSETFSPFSRGHHYFHLVNHYRRQGRWLGWGRFCSAWGCWLLRSRLWLWMKRLFKLTDRSPRSSRTCSPTRRSTLTLNQEMQQTPMSCTFDVSCSTQEDHHYRTDGESLQLDVTCQDDTPGLRLAIWSSVFDNAIPFRTALYLSCSILIVQVTTSVFKGLRAKVQSTKFRSWC